MPFGAALSTLPGRSGFTTGPPSARGRSMRAVPMSIHSLHARFLLLLPRIEAHAKIYFRDIRCAAQRADQIAETVALAWKWFVRLAKRGKDASKFVTTFATFAARAVRCGRRVVGRSRAKDVMDRHTQKRY